MPETNRILIVDDEPTLMKALCDTLRDQGLDTLGFTSPKAALEALKQSPFDLLLADLMMPEMDGITLLQEAQKIDSRLVAIIMTGEGTIATAVEAMKTGALDFVLKPFKLSAIMPVLSRALVVRELRMQNEELQTGLRERTDQLERANKDLEAFSYSVSHDLRAPLRSISGFTSILLEDYSKEFPVEAKRLLDVVIQNTKRMNQLIDDLLEFSRLGRQHLSKRTINVSSMIHEVIAELRKQSSDRKIQVRIGDVPDCVGDPSLLKQVFINLLSNAFKFTARKPEALIEVDGGQRELQKYYFVRDNGAGFDMRYADRLFGVFQRLHTVQEFEGTGVGLSIVKRIVERHGGEIWVEAEQDKGATFHFTLSD